MMSSLVRGRARDAIALGTFTLLTAFAVRAEAFCRTTTVALPPSYSPVAAGCFTEGLPLFWKNACVTYSVQRSASRSVALEPATAVIEAAFATWSNATCAGGGAVGIKLSHRGPVDCAQVNYNRQGPNQNVIVFRDDDWPYNDPYSTLGLTTVTFNADTGEIYDADMEINAAGATLSLGDPVDPQGFDLLSVITHEAGHFLGLAHATESRATMHASYRQGSSDLRSLMEDDVDGLCAIYPDAKTRAVATSLAPSGVIAAEACNPTPRHGFGRACEQGSATEGSTTGAEDDEPENGGCATSPAAAASPLGFLVTLALVAAAVRRRRVD